MSVFIGVILAIIASSMLNIGQALQKKTASELPNIENTSLKANLKNFLTNKIWLLGWLMGTVQWYIYLYALTFADLSLVSAMTAVGLVVLVIFSRFYLKEPVSKVELIGVGIISVGVIILASTNVSTTSEPLNLSETITVVSKPSSIILTIILFAFIVFPILNSIRNKYKKADVVFGIAGGILGGIGAIYSNAMMSAFVDGFSWDILITTITTWQWWVFMVLLFIGNMGVAPIQQVGFQKGKAVIVAPLTSITNLVVSIIGGVVVFSEWGGLDTSVIIIKVISIVTIVSGVAVLSFLGKSKDEEENQDDIKKEEIEEDKTEIINS